MLERISSKVEWSDSSSEEDTSEQVNDQNDIGTEVKLEIPGVDLNTEEIGDETNIVPNDDDNILLIEEIGKSKPNGWAESIIHKFKRQGNVFCASMQEVNKVLKAMKRKELPFEKCFAIVADEGDVVLTQLSVKAGVQLWGTAAIVSSLQEMDQLLRKNVFIFKKKSSLTREQLRKYLRTLMFLKQKKKTGELKEDVVWMAGHSLTLSKNLSLTLSHRRCLLTH